MATDLPFYECETDDGDSIGVRISLLFELLAKDVGVDFFINELQAMELHQGPERFEKRIYPAEDRRSGIKNEPTAGPEASQTLLDDSKCELNAKLAPSVPVEPSLLIHEIRGVADNEIGFALDSIENVAERRLGIGKIIQCGVHGAECERLMVDIGEDQLYGAPEQTRRVDTSCPTPATDIDKSEGSVNRFLGER